ncbi:hypothetical protein [Kribbella sp. CA-247076]|uniref:hypothetical protein n=1 Tax=Kribbella sp. CA-247076 TaxID=3239941 RepID=UPI003D929CA4
MPGKATIASAMSRVRRRGRRTAIGRPRSSTYLAADIADDENPSCPVADDGDAGKAETYLLAGW